MSGRPVNSQVAKHLNLKLNWLGLGKLRRCKQGSHLVFLVLFRKLWRSKGHMKKSLYSFCIQSMHSLFLLEQMILVWFAMWRWGMWSWTRYKEVRKNQFKSKTWESTLLIRSEWSFGQLLLSLSGSFSSCPGKKRMDQHPLGLPLI